MAKFVKGDYVQITPQPELSWEHWSEENTKLCNRVCQIVELEPGDWVNETYIRVDYQGELVWFRDNQMIKVKKYDEIYNQNIHDACHRLQKNEKTAKRVRDEILNHIFGEPKKEEKAKLKEDVRPDDQLFEEDEFFDDWQEVTTKEIIPLPGKSATSGKKPPRKSKNKKIKGKVKKSKLPSTKKKVYSSSAKGAVQTLVDEDLAEEIEKFLDSLPPHDNTDDTGDFDFEYFFGDDGNAD